MGHQRIMLNLSWDYWALPFAIGVQPFNSMHELTIRVGPFGVSILIGEG